LVFTLKLLADKRAVLENHQLKSPRSVHRILVREALKYGISNNCREVDLLVGEQQETLNSPGIVQKVIEYHDFRQIVEAVEFPYGFTVRTKVNQIVMVTAGDEPLLDVVDYLIWAHQRAELRDDEREHLQLGASMSRTTVGGSYRFPGIRNIYTCSTWLPKDPILARKPFPLIGIKLPSPVLPKVLGELNACIKNRQTNAALHVALESGSKIAATGDRNMDTLLCFGHALFEVIDREGILLILTEDEFCDLKRGSAICCWLRKYPGRKPPFDNWDQTLEKFLSHITGQRACVSWN
jgi:hypothetical protein